MKVAETTKFKPTYLCIKEHSITELKYLCKTTQSYDKMLKYKGSGKYWNKHLTAHGKEYVETRWFCLFTDKDELVKFALMLSEHMNIVKAKDANGKKIWANLMFENGLDGGGNGGANKGKKRDSPAWNKGKKQVITAARIAAWSNRSLKLKGKPTPMLGLPAWNKGIKENPEVTALRSKLQKGKLRGPQSEEHRVNGSKSKKGIINLGPQEKVKCPYCPKEGGISIMKRWHFDNCKLKE